MIDSPGLKAAVHVCRSVLLHIVKHRCRESLLPDGGEDRNSSVVFKAIDTETDISQSL